MIQTFTHPKSCDFSKEFTLEINGQPIEILHTNAADFANFIYDPSQGPAEILITWNHLIENATIRPLSKNLTAQTHLKELRFTLHKNEKLSIEIQDAPQLFLWANPPETDTPSPNDPNVRWFKAGQTYELGKFEMKEGQTLYIQGGAVVKGRIHTNQTDNITIRGHGLFDGSYYDPAQGHMLPSILIERCKNITIRDITMIHPSGWMLVPTACDNVKIYNLKQIGEVISSDGIDIVGSKNVHVTDCFLRNNDDCLVVKAFLISSKNLTGTHVDGRESPENILLENCTLLNATSGNAMEIGHELSVEHVSNVTFRNIDVISVHGQGAVFSLHNNDRAEIRNILFEDIRIEHCYDKFIDFRISKSRFSTDDQRGNMRNITLRNINWLQNDFNQGYTLSLIGGWDDQHNIHDIKIENLCLNGTPIKHIDELEITTRYATDIRVT